MRNKCRRSSELTVPMRRWPVLWKIFKAGWEVYAVQVGNDICWERDETRKSPRPQPIFRKSVFRRCLVPSRLMVKWSLNWGRGHRYKMRLSDKTVEGNRHTQFTIALFYRPRNMYYIAIPRKCSYCISLRRSFLLWVLILVIVQGKVVRWSISNPPDWGSRDQTMMPWVWMQRDRLWTFTSNHS